VNLLNQLAKYFFQPNLFRAKYVIKHLILEMKDLFWAQNNFAHQFFNFLSSFFLLGVACFLSIHSHLLFRLITQLFYHKLLSSFCFFFFYALHFIIIRRSSSFLSFVFLVAIYPFLRDYAASLLYFSRSASLCIPLFSSLSFYFLRCLHSRCLLEKTRLEFSYFFTHRIWDWVDLWLNQQLPLSKTPSFL